MSGCPHCRSVKASRARVHSVPEVTQHWTNLEKVSGNHGQTVLLAENLEQRTSQQTITRPIILTLGGSRKF